MDNIPTIPPILIILASAWCLFELYRVRAIPRWYRWALCLGVAYFGVFYTYAEIFTTTMHTRALILRSGLIVLFLIGAIVSRMERRAEKGHGILR